MATGPSLSKQQAALDLDVSTKTIDRLRSKGELEWFTDRKGVRIPVVSLEAYKRRLRAASADPFAIPALELTGGETAYRRRKKKCRRLALSPESA